MTLLRARRYDRAFDEMAGMRLSGSSLSTALWEWEGMARPHVIYQAKPGSALEVNRALLRAPGPERGKRTLVERFVIPRRSGRAWPVRAGQIFRIVAIEGPQVADLNVWSLANPRERFWASRSRQLHQAHVSTFDRLWSCLPYLRPMLDDHGRHRAVRPRRRRRRLSRSARHPLRSLRAQAAQRRGVGRLLPQQPRARRAAVSPDRARRARRPQRVPGHRPHRRGPLLHQAEPRAGRRLHRVLRRDRRAGRALGVPARRYVQAGVGPGAGDGLDICRPLAIEIWQPAPSCSPAGKPRRRRTIAAATGSCRRGPSPCEPASG